MWVFSIVVGVVLLALGFARSYRRFIVTLLIATIAGGVLVAMMNQSDAAYAVRSMAVAW